MMKIQYSLFAATIGFSALANAGDTSKKVIPPYVPPTPDQYFLGGAVGYLFDNETEFYSLHFGKDLNKTLGGWDQAIYAELGYASIDGGQPFDRFFSNLPGYEYDFELIPLTLNYKLERAFNANWKFYTGVGAGVAFTDSKFETLVINPGVERDSETVFFAQAFAGSLYQVSETFELYGGLRYIYFDEPNSTAYDSIQNVGGVDNSDFLLEVGARFNF